MPITHAKVSGKSDGGDATLVLPSDWNASHTADVIALQSGAGSKSLPGWTQHSDIVPSSPNGNDDEFDTTNSSNPITGWTAIGSLSSCNTNTTKKSHLYLNAASNAAYNLAGIYKAWSPSNGDTVTIKVSDRSWLGTFQKVGVFVGEATPGKTFGMYIAHETNLPFIPGTKQYSAPSGGSLTNNVAAPTGSSWFPFYLRIVYNSSTSIQGQISLGGHFWRAIATAVNVGFTVGSYGLVVSPENTSGSVEALIDWIRFNWTP